MLKRVSIAAVAIVGLSSLAHADATPGQPAPPFEAKDAKGVVHKLSVYKGKCPAEPC